MVTLSDVFPVFGLRISAGPLELRAITDDDLAALAELAARGIHPRERMPFALPWTDVPAEEFGPQFVRHHWRTRADFRKDAWALNLGVWHEGTPVGVQGITTKNYLVTRTGETGSWLGQEFQGRGIGTSMRQVICAFVFDHLDAVEITSGAWLDNPASLAVSRKVGYRENGRERKERRDGEVAVNQGLVLRPEDLVRGEHALEVEGVEAFRTSIGL